MAYMHALSEITAKLSTAKFPGDLSPDLHAQWYPNMLY